LLPLCVLTVINLRRMKRNQRGGFTLALQPSEPSWGYGREAVIRRHGISALTFGPGTFVMELVAHARC